MDTKMDMDMDMDMNMTDHSMHMNMYFNNQLNFFVLFESWMVMSQSALIGSSFGCLFLGILYEGMKG